MRPLHFDGAHGYHGIASDGRDVYVEADTFGATLIVLQARAPRRAACAIVTEARNADAWIGNVYALPEEVHPCPPSTR